MPRKIIVVVAAALVGVLSATFAGFVGALFDINPAPLAIVRGAAAGAVLGFAFTAAPPPVLVVPLWGVAAGFLTHPAAFSQDRADPADAGIAWVIGTATGGLAALVWLVAAFGVRWLVLLVDRAPAGRIRRVASSGWTTAVMTVIPVLLVAGHVAASLWLPGGAVVEHRGPERAGVQVACPPAGRGSEAVAQPAEDVRVRIEAAVRDLGSAEPQVRSQAATALRQIGPDAGGALPALVKTLSDADLNVQMAAASALGRVASRERALCELLPLVRGSNVRARVAAVAALAGIRPSPPEVVAALVEATGDVNSQVRGFATEALGHVGASSGDAVAVAAVIRRLDDPDTGVRVVAAMALGEIGAPAVSAVPRLERLASEDQNFAVRDIAAMSAGRLKVASRPRVQDGPARHVELARELVNILDDAERLLSKVSRSEASPSDERTAAELDRLATAATKLSHQVRPGTLAGQIGHVERYLTELADGLRWAEGWRGFSKDEWTARLRRQRDDVGQAHLAPDSGPVNIEQLATLKHANVYRVLFSPDSRMLATMNQEGVKLWDVASSAAVVERMVVPARASEMVLSPDGRWLATAGRHGLAVWNTRTGQPHPNIRSGSEGGLAFSPDGKILATNRGWWEVDRARILAFPQGYTEGQGWASDSVGSADRHAFSADGKTLLSIVSTARPGRPQGERPVVRWNVADGRFLEALGKPDDAGGARAPVFAPGAPVLARTHWDKRIHLWNIESGRRWTTQTEHASGTALAFSSDGTRLVSGGEDGTIKVWRAETGQELARAKAHADQVAGVALSADGSIVATCAGSDELVKLWRVRGRSAATPPPEPGRAQRPTSAAVIIAAGP